MRITTPAATPTTMPTSVPNTERMTASIASMPRTWPFDVPIARSRPISFVRSDTLSANVLTMPKIAMMIDNASSA